jgi:gamma-tubulin complex component 4
MVLQHELLLALAGHVGGEIFAEREGTFALADGLPLLDQSEQVAVNDLLPLGALYKDVNAFVERHLLGALGAGASGLYVRSLCTGMDAELDAYRDALLVLEDGCKAAAADALGARGGARGLGGGAAEPAVGLSVARMQHELTEYFWILPALRTLAVTVEEERVRGARVLELVHAHAAAHARTPTGESLRRVLRHCNATLLHQARGWMIRGVRFDPHAEFFVQPAAALESGGGAARWRPPERARAPECAPAYDAAAELLREVSCANEEIGREWASLRVSLYDKPAYIPLTLAERMLFIGKAARVLEQRTFMQLTGPARARGDEAAAGGAAAAAEVAADAADEAQMASLDAQLEGMQWQAELSAPQLGAVVDQLGALAARRLWRFVVVESELRLHLHALQALALTARGDLAHALVHDDGDRLMRARAPPTDRQLTALLHALVADARAQLPSGGGGAARGGSWEEGSAAHSAAVLDLISSHCELQLDAPEGAAGARGADDARLDALAGAAALGLGALGRWRRVRLRWRVEWPLSLLLGGEALVRYNCLFAFLLAIRVAQAQLQVRARARVGHGGASRAGARARADAASPTRARQHTLPPFARCVRRVSRVQAAWITPQSSTRGRHARARAGETQARLRPARALRAQMGFLVDALHFYLHADVLEPCWAQLDARVRVRRARPARAPGTRARRATRHALWPSAAPTPTPRRPCAAPARSGLARFRGRAPRPRQLPRHARRPDVSARARGVRRARRDPRAVHGALRAPRGRGGPRRVGLARRRRQRRALRARRARAHLRELPRALGLLARLFAWRVRCVGRVAAPRAAADAHRLQRLLVEQKGAHPSRGRRALGGLQWA